MKIVCDTNFKHGREAFVQGDQRTVDDELGAYFVKNGWAHEPGSEPSSPSAGDVTLEFQSATHKTAVRNG